jgi:hypothetical protein
MTPYHVADECNLVQVQEKQPWLKIAEFNGLENDTKKSSSQPHLN